MSAERRRINVTRPVLMTPDHTRVSASQDIVYTLMENHVWVSLDTAETKTHIVVLLFIGKRDQ